MGYNRLLRKLRSGGRSHLKRNGKFLLVLAVAAAVIALIGCPTRTFLGVSCPGCGMTRAVFAALLFDFHTALYYHPLFWTTPLLLLLFFGGGRLTTKKRTVVEVAVGLLFAGCYAYRLLSGRYADIVYWDFHRSIIFKLIGGF